MSKVTQPLESESQAFNLIFFSEHFSFFNLKHFQRKIFNRSFYLISGGLFIIATLAQFIPGFGDEKNAPKRIGLFMFWAIYGIIPTIHWVTLHPDNIFDPLVTAMLPRIIFMYFICGIAFFFYVTKLPERFFPGTVGRI